MSHRVVFFGNERLVSGLKHTDAPILSGLIDRGYDVVAVIASHSDAQSRTARELEVAQIAHAHGIPLYTPDKPSEIIDTLRNMHADFAVLSAYGRIIPQRIIDIFSPIGIINIHPSLLPRHRGPTPIESTILAGDKEAGVSIMQLSRAMDEGPIYVQSTIALIGNETKFELYARLNDLASQLFFDTLPSILDGTAAPTAQSNSGVTYTSLIQKSDGIVNPSIETAEVIARKVRAHLGFPKTKLRYKNNDVILTAAKSIPEAIKNELCVPCMQNSTLLVESLIAPNGKSMSGAAYLRGLR